MSAMSAGTNTRPSPAATACAGASPARMTASCCSARRAPARRTPANGATGLGVNAYLWRATLDTLAFMPLASADPFGGVIITDWYAPPGAGAERFKATAYVMGRQLRSDGVRISIFRQIRQGQNWVDAVVAPATGAELEDRVLARARELRSQSGVAGR